MKIEYSGIRRAIHHLELAKKRYTEKFHNILDEIAQAGYQIADAKFNMAGYPGDPTVDVHIVWDGDYSVSVEASGTSVLFIEFGSGVNYEESPYVADIDFKISEHGTYGKGQGANEKGWIYNGPPGTGNYAVPARYYDKDGNLKDIPGRWRTWGSPPAYAMYGASKEMHDRINKIIERGLK